MVVKDTRKLHRVLRNTYTLFKNAQTLDERVALANYIGNLYASIVCMGDDGLSFDKYRVFGGRKKYEQIMDRLDDYSDDFIKSFLDNKKFHNEYFGELLPEVEDEMTKFCPLIFPDDKRMSRRDFFDILSLFMENIGLKKLFDDFYRKGRIYSSVIGQDEGNLGFTLYNPINGRCDLFVRDLTYDLDSLNTLVHEIGHAYDLGMFNGDVQGYNEYFYLSLYGEVISKLFERLLFRFLIKNDIFSNSAKDKFIDFNVISHDYFLLTYLLSALDDTFIKSDKYIDCDSSYLAGKVAKYVFSKDDIIDFFERMGTIDLSESLNYAYGDVVSLFLCDRVENDGFDNEEFRKFLEERGNMFNSDFLRDVGYGPSEYCDLYKREIQLIKK